MISFRLSQLITVMIMFSIMSRALGMSGTPSFGHERSVNIGGNIFTFSMPEDFSKDMPAEDMVEHVDLAGGLDSQNIARRWWDVSKPGLFGKALGTVMMDVSVHPVPPNQRHILDNAPFDITKRLGLLLALDEHLHQLYEDQNRNPEFGYSLPELVLIVGDEVRAEYRDAVINGQNWTRFGIAGPLSQLLVGYVLPIDEGAFICVTFTYSPNQGTAPREFLDIAYSRTDLVQGTFRVDYTDKNPVKDVVEAEWLKVTTDQVVDRHRTQLIRAVYGESVLEDLSLPDPKVNG